LCWRTGRSRCRSAKVLFAVLATFGAAIMVFALSTHLILSLAVLAVMGAADVVSVVIRFALVQLRTPPAMRGRVSAVNSMFTGTSNYLGDFPRRRRGGSHRRRARRADRRAWCVRDRGALGVPIPATVAYPYLRGSACGQGVERGRDQAAMTALPSTMPKGVQTVTVTGDENGMRLDRFFEARFPGLSFSHIQRIIRKGEVRVNGKRAQPKDRLQAGQAVRIPPLKLDAPKPRDNATEDQKNRAFIKSITLHEDADVMVLNKPMGLAVQGGSGTVRHLDGMLDSLRGKDGQRPRLVHRLDKDTAGCLLVARTRFAAAALSKTFRSRAARKIYWALVAGVPRPTQGRISTFLAKEEREDESLMRIAKHGDEGASHAVTYYAVVETAARQLAWLSLKPVTGRTHQLRAHMAHIGHPIVGDPKYFSKENWEFPGGLQNRLHLLARRIVVPHPRGGVIDVTAPLPPHMQQSWNLIGFDTARYDPIVEAPEE
jgi:23S rRNA pseudouridine955/2504/2580 synthase